MANFLTSQNLQEINELTERWEVLSTDELKHMLDLCTTVKNHTTNITELWGVSDYGMIDGLTKVIAMIEKRLEV